MSAEYFGVGRQLTRCSDSDNSGSIDYDEFKKVFQSTINHDSIPFDFDWCVLKCSLVYVTLIPSK